MGRVHATGGMDRRALLLGLVAPALIDQTPPPFDPDFPIVVNLLTRMAARVSVNGLGDLLFVIDTGAERTVIASEIAAQLALPPGPVQLVHGVTAAVRTPSVFIDRMVVGGRTVNDLVAPTFARAALGADGLIGLDVLSGFELRIDLRRRTVGLRPAQEGVLLINPTNRLTGTRLGRVRQGRAGRFGQLLLTTDVEQVRLDGFIDSGAQYSIGNRALLRALGPRPPAPPLATDPRVYGVAGAPLDAVAHEVDNIRIAGRRLGPTRMLFSDLHIFEALGLQDRPALLIGADILSRFGSIALNFGRSEILLGSPRRGILG